MKYVEFVLQPLSDWMTPWQADTLFGHIAWSIRYEQGEQALAAWLRRFEGEQPPFILSDGFIGSWLPRPQLHSEQVQFNPDEAKKRKSLHWINREALLRGDTGSTSALSRQGDPAIRIVHHNVLDRLAGTSLSEHGLYAVEQFGLPEGERTISVYAAAQNEAELAQLHKHFEKLALTGYGKRKSVGMGHFKIVEIIPRDAWFQTSNTNAHMWLSHGVPAPGDPLQGCYRLMTKYGKLGEGWGGAEPIFKRPLTRITPGALFCRQQETRPWSGKIVHGISDAHASVVQYGLALTLPLRLKEDAYDALAHSNTGWL